MGKQVNWGVLSTANIGVRKVIPATQAAERSRVAAIASRSLERAQEVARHLGIDTAYGSYEELLADPTIDAIYNPLPNHLHVPWTIRALEAGKHVLCEKPLAMTAVEAASVADAAEKAGRMAIEAFMIRHHPQWLRVMDLIAQGAIGKACTIEATFCYFNDDPTNVRNRADIGGGALYDVGCYVIHAARTLFGEEPEQAIGLFDRDPMFETDRVTSGIVQFPLGRRLTFTVSTQLSLCQKVRILGTSGRIEFETPFNCPPSHTARIILDDGRDLTGGGRLETGLEPVDQYRIQTEAFCRSVLGLAPPPLPARDAEHNAAVLEALLRSERSKRWEAV